MDSIPAQPRGERTREATDRKITQATLQIALSQGIGAITIEEVARQSGVAKTTIYRRYRNSDELLRTLRSLGSSRPDDAPVPEPTRENLYHLLGCMMNRFTALFGLKAVGMVLASDNEYFHHIIDNAIRPEEARFVEFIESGMRAGVFREGVDPRLLFATMLGSMLAGQALHDELADGWAEHMVGILWDGISAS